MSVLHLFRVASSLLAACACAVLMTPRPVHGQIAVNGDLVREHVALPGRHYTGSIDIQNPSGLRQDVEVTLADYHFDAGGSSRFEPAGSLERSMAGWVTFSPARVTLGPGERTEITYAVQVPESAGAAMPPSGSFWTALMIESRPSGTGPLELERGEVGLSARLRYAVQLAAHIESGQVHELDLTNVRVSRESGAAVLSFDVTNIGTLAYRPIFEIQIFDQQGAQVGTFHERRGLVFPGTSLRQRFELGMLEHATYEAFLTIDTGAPDLLGSQFSITP